MSANPLIATSGGHSSASLAGAGLIDSGQALSESIGGGSWVEGGLAGFVTTMDVVSAVTNPLGSLFSAGIGWVIEHFDPIKGWFDDLAGNAGDVDAFARTWSNVAGQLRESGELLQRRVNSDMAEMDGAAVTAYCTYATDVANHLKGSGDWAESISKGLGICSTLVQVTHDLARDCLAEVVGTALGLATELALTVGLAAPHALQVISTKVSSLAAKLGKAVTKLLHSFKALKALLKELGDLLKKAKGAFDGLPGGGAGRGAIKGTSPTPGSHLPKEAQEKIAAIRKKIDDELASKNPEYWRTRRWEGDIFNWENYHRYDTKEVYLEQTDSAGAIHRYKLDSYTPGQDVVFRRNTQFSDIQPATARSYISEAANHYAPTRADIVIADTPTTRAQLGEIDGAIGSPLDGQLIFEVPVQDNGVPQDILEYAADRGVTIRDVNGTVYSSQGGVP